MSVQSKIKTLGWSALGLCCVILLVAAMKSKSSKACKDISVNIEGVAEHVFVKKADVVNVLSANNIRAGESLSEMDLRKVEEQLENNGWIKDAELYFDNRQSLHVNITEREPIARIFTMQGSSFYIDSSGLRLPVNENATARVIVFTSFPSDRKILSKPDSMVLTDVKHLAQYINADSFLTAQTAQINITQKGTYEIIPVIGNQIIRIGNADSLDEKFTKLFVFYKTVWSKTGFEKYAVIDVQYHGQVVAIKRGENYSMPDTAKAMRQLVKADSKLNRVLNDTMYAAPMKKTNADAGKHISTKQIVSKAPVKKASRKVVRPTNNKTAGTKNADVKKPKAVMPRKKG
jgi:cell division protein FtsQ